MWILFEVLNLCLVAQYEIQRDTDATGGGHH